MERIETENLVLRKAKPSDLEAIYNNIWSDEEIASTMLWTPTHSLEDAAARLERTIKLHAEHYAYFVCLKETDEAIGFAGVFKNAEGYCEESGICIAHKYQGRGFGKEILKALLDLAFFTLDADKFLYACMRENERSKRVALHFGFEYEKSTQEIRKWDNKSFVIDYYILAKDNYIKTTDRSL